MKKHMLIVFIDGGFWHGFEWEEKKDKIKTNREFRILKIERNMQRDRIANDKLEFLGFKVLRFWEKQIKRDLPACIDVIKPDQ